MDLYGFMSVDHYTVTRDELKRAGERGRWRHELHQIEERERAERECGQNETPEERNEEGRRITAPLT